LAAGIAEQMWNIAMMNRNETLRFKSIDNRLYSCETNKRKQQACLSTERGANVVKSIEVQDLVQKFSLEVLAGADRLNRPIVKARAYRPGLEFVGYFDYFPQEHVQVLGRKEITYLHSLTEEERNLRIGNIVKYHPPCFIVTAEQEGLKYLTKYCELECIPLLRTKEKTAPFLSMLDA
jgi:HPr kinase/phosphorylase